MNNGPFGDPGADESGGLAFRVKSRWHRITAPFTNDVYDLSLPIVIASISAVAAVFLLICWFYITTKIATIHFDDLAFTTDHEVLHFLSHCLV
jgi:hypothetical protein